MPVLDTIIRNANVVTATDNYTADVGIRDGVIQTIGTVGETAENEIDAAGRMVTPGGVDSHCHLDQPMDDGSIMADDFTNGTISAACGGSQASFAGLGEPFSTRPLASSQHSIRSLYPEPQSARGGVSPTTLAINP